ncbi:MAG: hypothetical protein ACLPY1_21870 [Terracidiphilus sp.]
MSPKETAPGAPVTAAPAEKPDLIETMTKLYTTGIERVAEFQKKGFEIALQHNAELVKTWKKHAEAAPGLFALEAATTAFERYADFRKSTIDMVVEQTRTLAGLVKEREVKATEIANEGKARTQEAIEHAVAAQKTALDFSAKQTKVALEAVKQQFGYAGTPAGAVADSMQRGMEVVVEAQKDLLDTIKGPIQILH